MDNGKRIILKNRQTIFVFPFTIYHLPFTVFRFPFIKNYVESSRFA